MRTADVAVRPAPSSTRDPLARWGRFSWNVVGIAIVGYLLLHVIGLLRLVVVPVLVAVLVSTLLVPVARWCERHGVPRLLAAWLAFLVLVGAIVSAVYLVTPSVVAEFANLGSTLGDSGKRIEDWLANGPLHLSRTSIEQFTSSWSSQSTDTRSQLLHGVIAKAPAVVETVAAVVLTFVLTFFFVKDGDRIVDHLSGYADPAHRPGIDEFTARSWAVLTGYVRGSAANGVVNAGVLSVALWFLGIPLIVPIAVFTFVGSFIPVVGAIVSGGIAAAVALVESGPTAALVVVGVTVLIHHLESYLVGPLVMRRAVHLHPIAVILSIAAGSLAFGIVGAVVAVPLTAIIAGSLDATRESRIIVVTDSTSPVVASVPETAIVDERRMPLTPRRLETLG